MSSETPIPVAVGNAFPTGRFYIIEPSFWGGGKMPGLKIANEDALMLPGTYFIEPPNGDPNQYSERPHLVHVPKMGGLPRDFEEVASQWIVSESLKRVFESVDPEGFAFAACDFTLADGTPGPPLYFCNVVRILDAMDEGVSQLKIEIGDFVNGKFYDLSGGANLVFKQDIVGFAHVFRTPFAPTVFCDSVMHDRVKAADLSGVKLADAADC